MQVSKMPDLAFIYFFTQTFQPFLDPKFEMEPMDLEREIVKDKSKWIREFCVFLCQNLDPKTKSKISLENVDYHLKRLMATRHRALGIQRNPLVYEDDNDPLMDLEIEDRIWILYLFCNFVLEENDLIYKAMEKKRELMRLEPIGIDDKGNAYFHVGESVRVYRQSEDWEPVSSSIDELKELASQFKDEGGELLIKQHLLQVVQIYHERELEKQKKEEEENERQLKIQKRLERAKLWQSEILTTRRTREKKSYQIPDEDEFSGEEFAIQKQEDSESEDSDRTVGEELDERPKRRRD
ncbi:hypothetical protein EDD86DRAFT_209694 [Gorgonomyces haynaldii]|nr:hypothetical protein EDD86DRAFT_209694 [Gorgonomyces haynaldii]